MTKALRRQLIALSVSMMTLTGVSQAAEITYPKGVVELFTSQGCSSCPAADKVMGKFAKEDDILGLSWHVDYWDYLGWKDIFASRSNTERQYAYAHALGERQVYTPQAIINGRTHEVGSKEGRVRSLIKSFKDTNDGLTVPVNVRVEAENVKVEVEKGSPSKNVTLWMIFFDEANNVEILRGENTGRTINYHNVVKGIQAVGMVSADGLKIEYPLAEMRKHGFDGCALILQASDGKGNPGPILGATVISDI